LDLGQLEAFVQVANQRSFSRAAEALFLTQPSVTARIQALERDLGERLFERSGRGVRLTEVGSCFLPHAEHVLKALNEGRDAIDALRNLQSGSLIIASATTVSTYILPGVLKNFRSRFPRVEVSVRTGRSEQVLQMLLADEAQVGLVRAVYHQDIETRGLIEDELVLVVNADDDLARQGTVTVEQLGDHPFIFFDRNSSYYSLAQGLFRQNGVVPRIQMELDSMEASKKMVEEGLGVAMLPRIAVERELVSGVLREMELVGVRNPTRQIALISRRSRPLGPVAQAFVEIVQEIFVKNRPQLSAVGAV
jgi:LysR family transcriptional regulator, low CO2-responsive transcriptional regulator